MTPTLLHIDSSPLYRRSVSRELTAAFVSQWEASHPGGRVVYRDLNATAIPPVTAEWVGAVYTPQESRTAQQKELLALSDSLLAELEQTNEYVIGVPMHNFGVPAALKLWIDQIVRVGRTFTCADGTPKGLLVGKRRPSLSQPAASTTPRRRWPRSTLWSPICGRCLVFLAWTTRPSSPQVEPRCSAKARTGMHFSLRIFMP